LKNEVIWEHIDILVVAVRRLSRRTMAISAFVFELEVIWGMIYGLKLD